MILGHQKQIEILEKIFQEKREVQSLLFLGQEGIGKKTVGKWFLSKYSEKDLSLNPDYIFIEPEGEKIKIRQIQELSRKLALRPTIGDRFLVLIDDADKMTIEAQNCFLKTLEEPKSKTIFILVAKSKEKLLPTVVSRCQIIKFFPLPNKLIKEYLLENNIPEEEAEKISIFCQGRMKLAKEIVENKEKREFFRERQRDLILALNSDIPFRFELAQKIAKEKKEKEILEIWLSFLRANFLKMIKSGENFEKVKNLIEKIQTLYFHFQTKNLNSRVALENLFLEI